MTPIPELFIVNEIDRPDERHVVQRIGPNQYKYIHPDLENWRMMERDDGATSLADFGIEWVFFERNGVTHISCWVRTFSKATYKDGKPRHWQGSERFYLPYTKPIVQLVS